jgi:hypothetical protein
MTTATEMGEDAFTRAARTERRFCAAQPAFCDRCVEVLEAVDDELVCNTCGGRWPADSLTPCPRVATSRVIDEDGTEDRLCASHAAVWRRLSASALAGKALATTNAATV